MENAANDEYPLVSAIMLAGRVSIPDILLAIKCFRSQTYPYRELIIVNNARTQFEASELNIQAERDIFLVDTPTELSAGMARNYGIRASNGQILAQFDADYYHDPQRLSTQISALAENNSHVCVLSETLKYSYVSGRASLHTNAKHAVLGTMVFLRPANIDYPNFVKHEEFGILDKMIKADMNPISLSQPELVCKFDLTIGERIEEPINNGLKKKQYQIVKKILADRRGSTRAQSLPADDQKTSDDKTQELSSDDNESAQSPALQ